MSNRHNKNRLAVGPIDDVIRKALHKSAAMLSPQWKPSLRRRRDFLEGTRDGFLEPVGGKLAAGVIPSVRVLVLRVRRGVK
jgi:hypothetical protein